MPYHNKIQIDGLAHDYGNSITDALEVPHFCINSLWPSDAIWWQTFGSTLAQVMACCLTATSRYLSQCWLIINSVLWQSPKSKFTRSVHELIHSMCSDITLLKSLKHLPGGQWVKPSKCTMVYHKVVIYYMCERKQPVPVAGHLPTKGFGYCRKTPALRGHIAGVGEVGVPVAAKIYGQYRQCWSTRYRSIVMMRNRTW